MLDFEDSFNESFDESDGIPRIKVDSNTTATDIELSLKTHHDTFFRRIVDYVLNKLEGVRTPSPIAILVDEQGNEYDMQIEEDGYKKALGKANDYFVSIEEYETCDLIKQINEIIEKKQNGLR